MGGMQKASLTGGINVLSEWAPIPIRASQCILRMGRVYFFFNLSRLVGAVNAHTALPHSSEMSAERTSRCVFIGREHGANALCLLRWESGAAFKEDVLSPQLSPYVKTAGLVFKPVERDGTEAWTNCQSGRYCFFSEKFVQRCKVHLLQYCS